MGKYQTRHNKRYGEKNNKNGLCYFCRREKLPYSTVCETHYFKVAAKNMLNDRGRGQELRDLIIKQNYKCYLSGKDLILGINASINHIVPKKRRPDLIYDINNLAWCDMDINKAKNNLTQDEFIKLIKDVIIFIEQK